MNRIGALLIFHPDVTDEEATAALEKIKDVLDLPSMTYDWDKKKEKPFEMSSQIQEFDDEWGHPAWYIP